MPHQCRLEADRHQSPSGRSLPVPPSKAVVLQHRRRPALTGAVPRPRRRSAPSARQAGDRLLRHAVASAARSPPPAASCAARRAARGRRGGGRRSRRPPHPRAGAGRRCARSAPAACGSCARSAASRSASESGTAPAVGTGDEFNNARK